jgi:hypothetical protein
LGDIAAWGIGIPPDKYLAHLSGRRHTYHARTGMVDLRSPALPLTAFANKMNRLHIQITQENPGLA